MMVPKGTFRVWLITGTTSGFGRRLVSSVLARGDKVIATARSIEKLDKLFESYDESLRKDLRTMPLDVTEGKKSIEEKMRRAAGFWGRIDVLVNNAGNGYPGLLEEGGTDLLRHQFEPNVFGLMDVTLACLPYLKERKDSTLVIIGSRSAWKAELVGIGVYSASKAAVHALAETFTAELAPLGIRVLHVAPGAFRTEGIYSYDFYSDNAIASNDELRASALKRLALISGTQNGDPARAMEVLVDTVRGEGVAKGKPWPGLLVLGEDAERDLRNKCTHIIQILDEWKEVAGSCNFRNAL
ncbi:hypothetical protein AX15_003816 [Amanita polypyramis BW_CC]|nr:hypothetical protein AX15_003816 [Amanita polypyramis BW_CC]